MLGVVLLTSVLSNDQPFSCACERVAVTLTGDALRSQSGRAGLYTLMQDVTSLDRPVYRRADCDGDDEYLHYVGNGIIGWIIGSDYTSASGGISSSGSQNFICPEHASSWEFVSNGEWRSSGGVDVACCAAGSTCEDKFEDPCTGTSMDFGGGMLLGLGVGISTFCILLSSINAVKQKEQAALRSDAAVQCEGTLTAAPVESAGEGGSAHYLKYEFHVPGRILISAVPGLAASIPNDHGARATGRLKVHKELHQAHASGLPKSCTVRYLPVDPRRNQLLKVGDDDRPSRDPLGTLGRLVQVFPSMFTISCCIGLGFVLKIRIGSLSDMTPASTAAFIAVVGIFVVLAIAMNVRVYYMLNPCPCGTPRKAYCTLTWLSSPYQRPQPQPQPQPQPPLQPEPEPSLQPQPPPRPQPRP